MRDRIGLILVVVLIAVGCGSGDGSGARGTDPAPTSTTAPTPTSIRTVQSSVGDLEARYVDVGDTERLYWLYRPPELDGTKPAALVVNLHGAAETSAQQRQRSQFEKTAAQHGFVLVYADAGDSLWDVMDSPDIDYISAVVDAVSSLTAIDSNRVYAIGMSQGGEMASMLACLLPDRFAAFASVAMLSHYDPPVCPEPQPARMAVFVGAADQIYSIDRGLTLEVDHPQPPEGLAVEAAAWASTNGCQPEPAESTVGEGVTRREYDCPTGSDFLVYVHPGGHVWPLASYGIDTNEVIWQFLDAGT